MKFILLILVPVAAYAQPSIVAQPNPTTVDWGGTTTLKVSAAGQDLQYQWYLNGQPISAATSPTFKIDTAVFANAGLYYVTITDDEGTERSSIVRVTVKKDQHEIR